VATGQCQRRIGGGGAWCRQCLGVGRREIEREGVLWRTTGLSPFIGAKRGGRPRKADDSGKWAPSWLPLPGVKGVVTTVD
jgi:hypothetical protein